MDDIKTALMKEMESYFDKDIKRIAHARMVTEYAEQILNREGGDYPVVIAAAMLHDIGIHEAERKYGSASGKYQELEGPPIAKAILVKLDFTSEQIEEVCEIIAHHHSPGVIKTRNFGILYDADWIVNIKDGYGIQDRIKLRNIIERVLLTESGKALAREIY